MLRRVCQKLQGVRIVGVCADAETSKSFLQKYSIDLLILDPTLPKLNELKSLPSNPEIFFSNSITKLSSHGDTEVSPVLNLQELRKTLAKLSMQEQLGKELDESEYMLVKSDGKLVYIDLKELLFVQSLRDYVIFKMPNKRYVVHSTLKNIEQQFEDFPEFMKAHRSYIVNLNNVDDFNGNLLQLKENEVPVSRSYRNQVKAYFVTEDSQ